MISIGTTTFNANSTTQTTITFSGSGSEPEAFLWSDTSGIELSLNGSDFSDEVELFEFGTKALYVRTGDISGVYGLGYEAFINYEVVDEGAITINVGGGRPKEFDSLSFSFSPRNTTIQYNINNLYGNIAVGNTFSGTCLDHNYSFEVERVAEQGAKSVISGAAFSTKLTQTLINYQVKYKYNWSLLGWDRPKFTDHLSAISSAIGRTIRLIGKDFYPKTDLNIMLRSGFNDWYEYFSGTFSECLSRLIGWSSEVPSLTYNLYIDNNIIYIVQQGSEQNTRTPANWAVTPTITHTIRHTEWATDVYSTVDKNIYSSDAANSNEPYSGTITWNGTTLTYDNGLLTEESRTINNNAITATYTYDTYDGYYYLTRKETLDENEGTFTVAEYSYQTTGTERYLFEETVSTYLGTSSAGFLNERTLTRHVPISGGWYGTTVYDTTDGSEVEISSSLGQGAPGNRASQYLIDTANDALKPAGSQRTVKVQLNSVAKARQTYPVANLESFTNGIGLRTIGNALDNYENKEQITLAGEIVGENHIYNYNDIIVYNGNSYHLVSNNVTQTPNAIRQSITAVRWILQ